MNSRRMLKNRGRYDVIETACLLTGLIMKKRDRIICALDAGTCKTCLLIARLFPDGGLEMLASGFAGSCGLAKGVVVNVEEVAASIRRAAKEAESRSSISANRVVAGISGKHIQSHNFRGSIEIRGNHCQVTAGDMYHAVRAAQSIPLSPEREIIHLLAREFFVNSRGGIKNPVGLIGSQLDADLHVVSCDGALSQSLIHAANQAEIEVKRLILQSLASGEAVLTPEEKELGAVVIDIGGGTTDIAVFLEHSVCFSSVIPAGGANFTRDLVEGFQISREEAERIKVEWGSVLPDQVDPDGFVEVQGLGMRGARDIPLRTICENLGDRGAELLEMVRNDIARSGVRHKLVSGAILTGGGSMMKGLLELAESVLDMPVRQGMPRGFTGLEKELAHPIYACVVGLALLEAQHTSLQDFQLLPPPMPSLTHRILSWFEQ